MTDWLLMYLREEIGREPKTWLPTEYDAQTASRRRNP
jgi:hypothetical protein